MTSAGIGVLGGTFDPMHIGHLILAQEVHFRLGLERVLFVPNREPPHKQDREVTSWQHRVAMIRLAIGDNSSFALELCEIERHGPSYTLDTLRQIRSQWLPAEPRFILGGDAVAGLASWHQPDALLREFRFIVVRRDGEALHLPEISRALGVGSIADRITEVEIPRVDISSASIRSRVRARAPISYLVPPAVEEYVRTNGLYRVDATHPMTEPI